MKRNKKYRIVEAFCDGKSTFKIQQRSWAIWGFGWLDLGNCKPPYFVHYITWYDSKKEAEDQIKILHKEYTRIHYVYQ